MLIPIVLVVAFVAFRVCEATSGDSSTKSTDSSPPEMPYTVQGRGELVSEYFLLEPGIYGATINVSGNSDQSGAAQSFIVTLFTAALGHPSVLVEAVTTSGNWQTTTTVRDRQHFYLDIVATGEWTVTLEPV
ncbi:MAG: hypothetical protein F4Y02_03560 [Chloroflexi bacterium]|nr:hypothetical protein [Chloroflexota bacterium]